MEPIYAGTQGPAVEDIQTRLVHLGYNIDANELNNQYFGDSTLQAVEVFREDYKLPKGEAIDLAAWGVLVDNSYQLGDRTLYLRLPNFHGSDVSALQNALNVLGFACGDADGYFGPHTEAALQQFQENVGLFPDGMAFQDTFNYIDRLRHVWEGKPTLSHSGAQTGFARAATVLERYSIALVGNDPITRNIASRMWNIASATTENSGMILCDKELDCAADIVLYLTSEEHSNNQEARAMISLKDCDNLAQRLHTAYEARIKDPAEIVINLTGIANYSGVFTTADAQTLAIRLLDAVCGALAK